MIILVHNMKKNQLSLSLLLAGLCFILLSFIKAEKPTVYLVGDSTVAGGWGKFIAQYFDTTKVSIQNKAVSGTSSRTFYTGIFHDPIVAKKGMWKPLVAQLKRGDVVFIQFGHNDDSPVNDTLRARGSLRGIGNDSILVQNHFTKAAEVVHTYGWYLNRMVQEAKNKGATVVICSPVPKNIWKDGKIGRVSDTYGKWSKEVAENKKALFLDLNNILADKYEKEGEDATNKYFIADRVHPTTEGAMAGSLVVIDYIRNSSGLKIREYLK